MSKVNTPGCYGSVLSFSPDDKACSLCPHKEECGDTAYDQLLKMREEMDVSALQRKFDVYRTKSDKSVVTNKPKAEQSSASKRTKLTAEQVALVEDEELPVKPRKLLRTVFGKGYDADYLLKALKSGVNPFKDKKPKLLDVALELLIGGGFTKQQLHRTYMASGMAKRTAHSQVSIVVAALDILNLTDENIQSGRIKVKGEQ